MNKKTIIIPIIVAIIGIVIINITDDNSGGDTKTVFHVRLASTEQYQNGVYTEIFDIEQGNYKFTFVPNGDSPENLAISLNGENLDYFENFKLKGILHKTGISEYYTWEYIGDQGNNLTIESQTLEIQIDPKGNVMGPVSISLIEN